MQPYELLNELRRHGLDPHVVGSAATGEPARDLDIAITQDRSAVGPIRSALASIGVGRWQKSLDSIFRLPNGGVVSLETIYGPLDLHVAPR